MNWKVLELNTHSWNFVLDHQEKRQTLQSQLESTCRAYRIFWFQPVQEHNYYFFLLLSKPILLENLLYPSSTRRNEERKERKKKEENTINALFLPHTHFFQWQQQNTAPFTRCSHADSKTEAPEPYQSYGQTSYCPQPHLRQHNSSPQHNHPKLALLWFSAHPEYFQVTLLSRHHQISL